MSISRSPLQAHLVPGDVVFLVGLPEAVVRDGGDHERVIPSSGNSGEKDLLTVKSRVVGVLPTRRDALYADSEAPRAGQVERVREVVYRVARRAVLVEVDQAEGRLVA